MPKANEAIINGKLVTFRERFPLRDSRDLPAILAACGAEDTEQNTKVSVMRRCIESWEFDGNPGDAESYEDLDLFIEFLPILQALGEYIGARMGRVAADAKN